MMQNKGQKGEIRTNKSYEKNTNIDAFVLEKSIFSSVFEKDIRRVYIYKKSERLAKAVHLIAPAFNNSPALHDRLDTIAIGLVDGAILAPARAREALSRELLALSSVLAIARAGGLLSTMNSDLIAREAHSLLQEIATYEEPRLFFEEAPTLATLFKTLGNSESEHQARLPAARPSEERTIKNSIKDNKGQISDSPQKASRRDAILSILKSKGPSYIKDISTVVRGVSEKTIQRELATLVAAGEVQRRGERRWTTYSLTK